MTKENNKNELFRLAAVLYADNNYEVSTKIIHKKIIESALLDCNNEDLSIHELIDYIEEKYSLVLGEDEIIVITKKYVDSFHTVMKQKTLFICLSATRKLFLEKKIQNKTIDFFIDDFSEGKKEISKIKKLIYDFLYHMFSINTASFQKLINKEKDISDIISLQDGNYSVSEIEIINEFLNWDNEDKNKAIFNISSYALEFCLLTNKKGNQNFKLNNLKNKIFYLDTNILYRGLGINGEDRKKRTKTFLTKFKEAGEKLKITKITDTEFKKSIHFYVAKLKKIQNPKISAEVFLEFKSIKDINFYYHSWRKGKVNYSLELFESFIISEYKSFLENLKIEIDYEVPYDINNKDIIDNINGLYSSINKEKPLEKQNIESTYNDAENIFWIECKRNKKNENIFDTSFFFISTDNVLRKWDYFRSNSTPIVLLPSQWLSILLRYFDRTKDDYQSFVSFLNLRNNETIIEGETLNLIMSGISQMTSDVEQQRYLVSSLIDNNFKGVISDTSTNDEIIENSKRFAKTELEKSLNVISQELKTIQIANSRTKNKLELTDQKIVEIEINNSELKKQLSQKKNLNENLSIELIEHKVNEGIRKWRKPLLYLIPIGLTILVFYIFLFFVSDVEYNLPNNIANNIDQEKSETVKFLLRTLLYTPIIAFGWICIFCFKRFYSDYVLEKKTALEKKFKLK